MSKKKINDVKEEIKKIVKKKKRKVYFGQEVQDAVDLIRDIISADKYWAIYVSPDGEIDYVSTNDENDENYLTSLLVYEEAEKKLGGEISKSEDE